MKKILIWDGMISGHHIEYINHLYEMAGNDQKNKYIFSIQKDYDSVEKKIKWNQKDNIKFDFVDKSVNKSIFHTNLSIVKKVLRNKPDIVILVNIIDLFPFVPIVSCLFSRKTVFSGILYDIYLYKWKTCSWLRKIKYIILYETFKLQRNIKRIWVLNDEASTIVLNKKWRTKKYVYLPDPIPLKRNKELKKTENNHKEHTIYLHCGSLSQRKGTICLLDAIKHIKYDKGKREYVFLGRINKDIREVFYKKTKELSPKHDIIVKDGFCDFDVFKKNIIEADFIILPYKNTSKSSGIIGYSALFNKHVVVPQEGLTKRIVKKYKLGTTLKDITPQKLADFIVNSEKKEYILNGQAYVNSHRVIDFNNTINMICR